MFKLMKYEFRKTWITKLILLAITAMLEAVFLIGLYGDNEDMLGTSIPLLVAVAVCGVLVIGLESIITLHRDMNTKQSYMLFMTPNSSYAILGAKVLEFGLSVLLSGAFFFALGFLDITLLFAKSGELNQLWELIKQVLSQFSFSNGQSVLLLDTTGWALVTAEILVGWIDTVATAYLAVVVSAALLNGKKFNGLLSFVLFLLINWFTSWVARQVFDSIQAVNNQMIVGILISLGFSAAMYVITAQIMERKLSV